MDATATPRGISLAVGELGARGRPTFYMTSRTAVSVNWIRSLRPSTVFVDVCPRDTHTPHGLSCFRRGRRGTSSVHSTAPATGLTTLGTGLARTGTNTGTVYSKNRIKEKGVKITLRRLGFGTLKSTIASKQRTRRAVSTHLGHLTSLSSYIVSGETTSQLCLAPLGALSMF